MKNGPPQRLLEFEELLERLRPLCARPDLQLVVLFGSTARGVRRQQSDLDVGILGDEPLDLVDLTNQVICLTHINDVDLVDLRRASPLLAMEVARHGRLLYERAPGLYAQFYSLAYRRYVDTAKLRQAHKDAIAQFLRARGVM
jgi:predicted nucleotidyltransferase